MDFNERDTLIRVEEQLKETAKNHASMIEDLRNIFDRLEKESKLSTILSGELHGHVETSKVRWEETGKTLDNIQKSLEEMEERGHDGERLLNQERADRIEAITKESKAREEFEQDLRSSVRTIKWVFGTLAAIAAALSSVVGIIQFFSSRGG